MPSNAGPVRPAAPKFNPSIAPRGISAACMNAIVEQYSNAATQNLSDFIRNVIAFLVSDDKPSVANLYESQMDSEGRPFTADPTVMVSTSGDVTLGDLCTVIQLASTQQPDQYYWIDPFELAIAEEGDAGQQWMQSLMKQTTSCLFVMESYSDSQKLQNAWLAAQALILVGCSSNIVVAYPPTQVEYFRSQIASSTSAIVDAYRNVRALEHTAMDRKHFADKYGEAVEFLNRCGKIKEKMRDWIIRALDQIGRDALGSSNSDAIFFLNQLGAALHEAGKFSESIRYYHRALELTRDNDGIELAHTHFCIASLQSAQLQHKEALVSFKRALSLFREYGSEEQRVGTAYFAIGRALAAAGEGPLAINVLESALNIYTTTSKTSQATAEKGMMHIKVSGEQKSDRTISIGLAFDYSKGKDVFTEIGEIQTLLGSEYMKAGNYARAHELLSASMDSLGERLGIQHPRAIKAEKVFRQLLELESKASASAMASPTTLATMTCIGVSIEFLRKFWAEHQQLPEFESFTTTDVCKRVIVVESGPKQCAYIDLFAGQNDENGKPFAGDATVFVSHAWKYTFKDPVDAMEQYAQSHPNAYFWFDLFVNNQNIASSLPQEWWKTTFRTSIKAIGAVLLVLSPWDDPIPLTRAWCLWEIMCAVGQAGVKFEVTLPTAESIKLHESIDRDAAQILKSLSSVQAERAEAFLPNDRTMIFNAIRESVGFHAVNSEVKALLKRWFLQQLRETPITLENDPSDKSFFYALTFSDFGLFDESIQYFENAEKMFKSSSEAAAEEMQAALDTFRAREYVKLGNVEKAHELAQRALSKVLVQGRLVCLNQHTLGLVEAYRGNVAESFMHLQMAYTRAMSEGKNSISGQDSYRDNFFMSATVLVYIHYAEAQIINGDTEAAFEICEQLMIQCAFTIGQNHPLTALVHMAMGKAFAALHDYTTAIDQAEFALAILSSTQGAEHVDTGIAACELGMLYATVGDQEQARPVLSDGVALLARLLPKFKRLEAFQKTLAALQ